MNTFSVMLWTTGLVITTCSGCRAMVADQFQQMTADDRTDYVVALVKGTDRLLKEQGRIQEAQKLLEVFSDYRYDGFDKNVAIAVFLNKDRPANNKLHVEHAFIRTLQQNGIANVPEAVMTINNSFKPHGDSIPRNKK